MKKQKGLRKDSYCFYELIPLAPLSVFAPTSVFLAIGKLKKWTNLSLNFIQQFAYHVASNARLWQIVDVSMHAFLKHLTLLKNGWFFNWSKYWHIFQMWTLLVTYDYPFFILICDMPLNAILFLWCFARLSIFVATSMLGPHMAKQIMCWKCSNPPFIRIISSHGNCVAHKFWDFWLASFLFHRWKINSFQNFHNLAVYIFIHNFCCL
jgi:hypothetical protein